MTTLAGLAKHRTDLGEEAKRLRAEGDKRRLQNQPVTEIAARLQAIDAELKAVNFDYKIARHEHGKDLAKQLAADREFQAALEVLVPLIRLADAIDAKRGGGVTMPPLPGTLARIAAEASAYLEVLTRIGATGEK
jgi:hypothetical protein